MASEEKFHKGVDFGDANLDGSKLTVGIVVARWNSQITNALLEGCKKSLLECKVSKSKIVVVKVAGSFELPFGAKKLVPTCDAVICIGCLIKGETMHFEYICENVSRGIMDLGLSSGKPVIFGVLTCLNEDQALARAGLANKGKKMHNHGLDWGKTAVEMALLNKAYSS
ncbi:hypothetical protein AAMO2058_001164200 [Amorphochlora amoebiformis]